MPSSLIFDPDVIISTDINENESIDEKYFKKLLIKENGEKIINYLNKFVFSPKILKEFLLNFYDKGNIFHAIARKHSIELLNFVVNVFDNEKYKIVYLLRAFDVEVSNQQPFMIAYHELNNSIKNMLSNNRQTNLQKRMNLFIHTLLNLILQIDDNQFLFILRWAAQEGHDQLVIDMMSLNYTNSSLSKLNLATFIVNNNLKNNIILLSLHNRHYTVVKNLLDFLLEYEHFFGVKVSINLYQKLLTNAINLRKSKIIIKIISLLTRNEFDAIFTSFDIKDRTVFNDIIIKCDHAGIVFHLLSCAFKHKLLDKILHLKNKKNDTPLLCAVGNRSNEVAVVIINYLKNKFILNNFLCKMLSEKNFMDQNALIIATLDNNIYFVDIVLDLLSPNYIKCILDADKQGFDVIYYSVIHGKLEILQSILNAVSHNEDIVYKIFMNRYNYNSYKNLNILMIATMMFHKHNAIDILYDFLETLYQSVNYQFMINEIINSSFSKYNSDNSVFCSSNRQYTALDLEDSLARKHALKHKYSFYQHRQLLNAVKNKLHI